MLTLRCITCCLLISFFALPAQAQTWQWTRAGGSSNNSQFDPDECVEDMAVDRNGNIYTISNVNTQNLNVDGIAKQGWGLYGQDVMINSFSCNGTLRWSKVIGCEWGNDYAFAIRADSIDGIYAAMTLSRITNPTVLHIDTDTTVPGTSNKTLYLVKYDTAGNYKWLRGPEQDTIGYYTYLFTGQFDMEADGLGNTYWLCHLPAGIYGGSYIVSTGGEYMLHYDAAGAFKGATKMDMDAGSGNHPAMNLTRNPQDGSFYISGTVGTKIYVGNDSIHHGGIFIARFDKQGNFLWKRENVHGFYQNTYKFSGRLAIDSEGYVYAGGYSSSGDLFNGYTITHGSGHTTPFIVKMDNLGNLLWANDAIVQADNKCYGVALRNSGEVVLATEAGHLKWPGYRDSIVFFAIRPAITRFNTQTGKVLGMEGMYTGSPYPFFGGYAAPSCIIADGRNNIYVGGTFAVWLYAADIVYSTGGISDFSVTRYGYDSCDCSDLPKPAFIFSHTGSDYSFRYTGSLPYNSIRWDFGDGTVSTQQDPVHTYNTAGNYTVLLTVTNHCGDNTYGAVLNSLSVPQTVTRGIRIYPNPAAGQLYIEGAAEGKALFISDLSGRCILRSVTHGNTTTLNTSSLPAGCYILQLANEEGGHTFARFTKQ